MLGFIGVGSMGGAILRGILAAGIVNAPDVVITRKDENKAQQLCDELGVTYAASNRELVEKVGKNGVIILAVKPYQIAEVLEEIAPATRNNGNILVSVAAGTTLAALAQAAGTDQKIVRTMPNVASSIAAGMTAICPNSHVSLAELDQVLQIFESVGDIVTIDEKDFSAFSALAGCSPAWTFTYIDALSRAGLAAGLRKDESLRIAAQAVVGAAQLVLKNLDDVRPQALVDTVTSPGGTTIAGLIAMEKAGFSQSVISGVEAAIERDIQISQEK
ncbi:pyrroline-5-carboxylate reductase [Arcanobacterium pluranimalium]|uniref:pyrroline-5-carboxylate reductase n=1 Tax=Arcanobacterium pluranimalium TaxID=108028 RepID=UPI00195AE38A|nr:pyrroline-5-carboxylate reductase [Arcanobacterium pluranimalium]MBM7825684.1 pyrroline-5-carboxylate reductase [Arcanobacterium pluranimalium]